MKRMAIFLILMLMVSVFCDAGKKYVMKTIHTDGSASYKLNNRGEVAFIALDAEGKSHIFLYSGGETRQLTPDYPYPYSYASVDMNDHGQVVWPMWTNEGEESYKYIIMAWDGEKVYKALDTTIFSASIFPQVNNEGIISWQGTIGSNYSDIFMLSEDGLINVSNNQNGHDKSPVMNNNGWIAWHGDNRNLWDWTDRIRIAKPGETSFTTIGEGHFPKMDDNNHIIFSKYVTGTESNYYSLNLYDGAGITPVADHIWVDGASMYDINNGHVVFTKGGPSYPFGIYLWKDSVTTKISLPGTDNKNPGCNSQGMAVWMTQAYEVYVHRDGNTIKAGTDAAHIPQINNQGVIAWAGASIYNYGKNIYIAEYKDVFDVAGRIVLQDGNPLPGVSIFLNGEKAGETGENGDFTISEILAGNITISFSKPGYQFSQDSLSVTLSENYQIEPDIVASISTQTQQILHSSRLLIYPNPASGQFTVILSDALHEAYTLEVMNLAGQLLFSKKILGNDLTNGISMKTSGMRNGLYYVRIFNEKNTETLKLSLVK